MEKGRGEARAGAVKKEAKSEKLFECKRCTILIGSERRLRYR